MAESAETSTAWTNIVAQLRRELDEVVAFIQQRPSAELAGMADAAGTIRAQAPLPGAALYPSLKAAA